MQEEEFNKKVNVIKQFYSGEPCINWDSCTADPKKILPLHHYSPNGAPQTSSNKLNPAKWVKPGEDSPLKPSIQPLTTDPTWMSGEPAQR